jgi:hypothetical protein
MSKGWGWVCTNFSEITIFHVYSFMWFGRVIFLDFDAGPSYSSYIGCGHHVLSCVAAFVPIDGGVRHNSEADIEIRCRVVTLRKIQLHVSNQTLYWSSL